MSVTLYSFHVAENFVPTDIPPLCPVESSDDEEANENEDDDAEGGWMELEPNETTTVCLFCVKEFRSTINDGLSLAIEHMKSVHAFDLAGMKAKFCMDQYSFIKVTIYWLTMIYNKNTCCNNMFDPCRW